MLTNSQRLASMLNAAARQANKSDVLGFVDINGTVECITAVGKAAEGYAFLEEVHSIKVSMKQVYHVDFHIHDVYEADRYPEKKSLHVRMLQAALESAGLKSPVLVVPSTDTNVIDTEGDPKEVRAALALLLWTHIPVFERTMMRQVHQLIRKATAPISKSKTGYINRMDWSNVIVTSKRR